MRPLLYGECTAPRRRPWLWLLLVLCACLPAQAEDHALPPAVENAGAPGMYEPVQQVVEYPAAFFARYQPNTALDMVRQIPGFQLNDGGGARGFAASVGNLLINGRRPSAKQDLPSATLARIPAGQVDRIEIIHGQAQGIDLQGQSMLANVYLRSDLPASVRWEAWVQYSDTAPIKPGGNISMSDSWGEVDFIVGLDVERDTSGWVGTESEYDAGGVLLETGPTDSTEKGFRVNSLSLNASSWLGDNLVSFNSRLTANKTTYYRPASSELQAPGRRTRYELIDTTNKNLEYELGTDIERSLSASLVGKLILLYINDDANSESSQEVTDSLLGRTLLRLAETDTARQEQIARLEFDWAGFSDHALQFNLERAYNVIDRGLVQTDDRGAGPVFVDVPGANTRVEEVRWDLLLQDTWAAGTFDVDVGLGAEASTLSQTGDADQERDFFFLKPHAVLAYAPGRGSRTRLRLAREVSQLDLDDFVSATVLEDDDFALGNPDLRPQSTWVSELSHERRFGRETVIRLTVFHHWITDVLDLLPLSDEFEAPGNIGDGRRWGAELESSFPLEGLGLAGAKLDFRVLWQDTVVTDPVTGRDRRLSGEGGGTGYRLLETLNENIGYHFRVDYRQDFEAARVAWGWTVADRGSRPLYRVNELDVHSEGTAVDAFIETTRWLDLKIRLLLENLLNFERRRERTLYTGERSLTPVASTIVRIRQHDISRVALYVTGSF